MNTKEMFKYYFPVNKLTDLLVNDTPFKFAEYKDYNYVFVTFMKDPDNTQKLQVFVRVVIEAFSSFEVEEIELLNTLFYFDIIDDVNTLHEDILEHISYKINSATTDFVEELKEMYEFYSDIVESGKLWHWVPPNKSFDQVKQFFAEKLNLK